MQEEKIIPEMSLPTSVCPNPSLWHAYDAGATEIEVLHFLQELVTMLKPAKILETGCYLGYGTEQLALGARRTGFGMVYTCDVGHDMCLKTEERLRDRSLSDIVRVHRGSGLELIELTQAPIHFAFLDSGGDDVRCHELRAVYPKLHPGAVVAIHDSGIHTGLREFHLPQLLRELEMQYLFFDTPRGLALCRKKPLVYP